jgi:hypothetical protein
LTRSCGEPIPRRRDMKLLLEDSLVNEAYGGLEHDGDEARALKGALRALRSALGWRDEVVKE